MKAVTMACPCSGTLEWSEKEQALVCIKCGRHSNYQPLPSYQELLAENEKLKVRIKEMGNILDAQDALSDERLD